MKVIVSGAGQVGFSIARALADEHSEVTVIDERPEALRKVADSLDVKTILGSASHPSILDAAGAADTEMVIAVTGSDEVNMVTCQVAHTLFNVPLKIARIRSQNYLNPDWDTLFGNDRLAIDVIISPEEEVARAILRRFEVPGAIDVIPLAGNRVRLIGVRCGDRCPLLKTPLRQLSILFPDLNLVVIGIVRNGQVIVPSAEDMMEDDDEVYFVCETAQVTQALHAFGHDDCQARRVVVLGGGNIGLALAQLIEKTYPQTMVKLIDRDAVRCEAVAKGLARGIVLAGDVLDPEILHEAGVSTAETVVAVTDVDETNILAALLAKRYGAKRTMTLLNSANYGALTAPLGIDAVINPRAITVSNILQHVRRGRIHAIHSLYEGFGELIEADALQTSGLVGKPLRDVRLPSGVLLGAVVRDQKVISPRGSTVVQAGDRVVLFATADAIKKVEKLFSVRLEYF